MACSFRVKAERSHEASSHASSRQKRKPAMSRHGIAAAYATVSVSITRCGRCTNLGAVIASGRIRLIRVPLTKTAGRTQNVTKTWLP
jgi:hypothetical protein